MAQTLPPALEAELQKFDTMRRNFEAYQTRLQTLQQELGEVKATLEELKKQPDEVTTYKSVGQVMFKVEKPKLVEDLADRETTLEMRSKSTQAQLQSMSEKLKELQEKLQGELTKQGLRLS